MKPEWVRQNQEPGENRIKLLCKFSEWNSYFYQSKMNSSGDLPVFTFNPNHQLVSNRLTMTANHRLQTNLILALIFVLMLPGCSKKEEDPPVPDPTIPVLTTDAVKAITQTTAVCGGSITSDGGAPVTTRGICWNMTTTPEITDPHTSDGTGTGTFTSQMTGLTPNTLYYIRAYATNSKGTAYGITKSFRTLIVVVDTVTDIDGNIYHFVPIGGKLWLRENLRVKHYLNGEEIPQVTDANQWKFLTTGAYCTYDNLASNGLTYGSLYNWHALSDSRGICPSGWHVPSDSEWAELGDSLGGSNVAGGKLKSTGTLEAGTGLWYFPNTDATNSSGFSGLPGGYRINYGPYYSVGNVAYFWSSTSYTTDKALLFVLDANNGALNSNFDFKTNGFSVRCCKD
jgi:uncharacterized protein (TIGR02145 family)